MNDIWICQSITGNGNTELETHINVFIEIKCAVFRDYRTILLNDHHLVSD